MRKAKDSVAQRNAQFHGNKMTAILTSYSFFSKYTVPLSQGSRGEHRVCAEPPVASLTLTP